MILIQLALHHCRYFRCSVLQVVQLVPLRNSLLWKFYSSIFLFPSMKRIYL
jgi:hypothetical protein